MQVSIITLTLDGLPYVDEAIDSIERAAPCDIEHIVVHDGDPRFIQGLAPRHPAIKTLTGPGAGATAAAARGVDVARGDFILFLHADDRLCRGALSRFAGCAASRPEVKIWSGGARIFRTLPNGRETTVRRVTSRHLTRLSLENICDDVPLLSARFCHRSVFATIGNFDPNFSESSDREFLLRAVMAGITEAPLDVLVSEMRMHDGSRTMHHRRPWVPPYLAEHVRIADVWLGRTDIDGWIRRFLRNWRAREMLRLAYHRLRAGQRRSAIALLLNAELTDPLWILRALTIVRAWSRRLRNDGRKARGELSRSCPSLQGNHGSR